jgi:hypothetical protein
VKMSNSLMNLLLGFKMNSHEDPIDLRAVGREENAIQ